MGKNPSWWEEPDDILEECDDAPNYEDWVAERMERCTKEYERVMSEYEKRCNREAYEKQ